MFKNIFICLSIGFAVSYGADTTAQAQCRTIHHTDVDESGTAFSNNKCLLMCSIHGKLWPHNMSEGLRCPDKFASTDVCKNGQCVPSDPPIQLGYIDIEMNSAQLTKKAMVFADVCIQNASTTVTLPVTDRKTCLSCDTKVVSPTTAPIWNTICTGSNKNLFINGSRVTFEVWEQISSSNHNFAGGASILVSQVVANGDNHNKMNLVLANGNNSGNINVRITWTPK